GRRHADAVDAGTAGDRDAPAAFGARPEHGEGVVLDDDARRPTAVPNRLLELGLLGGKVDTGHEERRGRSRAGIEAGGVEGLTAELVEHLHRAVHLQMLRRAGAATEKREHLALRVDEREVRLRVAAVDCDCNGPRHATASLVSSASMSCSASASW